MIAFCFKSRNVRIFRNLYCGLTTLFPFCERILRKDLTTSLEGGEMPMYRAFAAGEVLFKHLTVTSLFQVGVSEVLVRCLNNTSLALNPLCMGLFGVLGEVVRCFCEKGRNWQRRKLVSVKIFRRCSRRRTTSLLPMWDLLPVDVGLVARRCGTLLASMWHFVDVDVALC